MAQAVMNMATVFQNLRIPDNARPLAVELPPPPALTGALTPNNWLAKAQRLAFPRLEGPESMAIDRHGTLFTGLKNGWVVAVRPNGRVHGLRRMSLPSCGRRGTGEEACGRPLGMRLNAEGSLVFVDSYGGIFKINARKGQFTQLVNSRQQLLDGRPLGFLSDLAILKDGTIFFTSSSSKWTHAQAHNILLEGEKSGRLLMFSPGMQGALRLQKVLEGLSFPNGLQLSRNEDYLLLAEGARARIYRVWIGGNSSKRGTVEVFADNLPGFVENIRLSPRNTYWVGLSTVRHSAKPSLLLDTYGARPDLRRRIMGIPKEALMARLPKYGLVVELNSEGKVIRSLHDPSGAVFPRGVTEVQEFQGKLYLGSPDRRFIGVLSLRSLPAPVRPGTAAVDGPTHHRPQPRPHPHPRPHPTPRPQPHPHPQRPNPNPNPNPNSNANPAPTPKPTPSSPKPSPVKPTASSSGSSSSRGSSAALNSMLEDGKTPLSQVLSQMTRDMNSMNGEELRDMVLVLLKQVIETRKEANKTMQRAVRLKSDMTKLKTMLGVPPAEKDQGKTDILAPESTAPGESGTGSAAAGTGSGTQNETSTPSPITVAPEMTSTSTEAAVASRTTATTQPLPTVTGSGVVGGGGVGGVGGVDGGEGAQGVGGVSPNDPSAPSFNTGCVSGSLACGVY